MSTDWRDAPRRPIFDSLRRIDGCGDWFNVYEIQTDTFALCEPDHYEEVISYVLIGRTYAALIDTGMGFVPITPIVRRLTALPLRVINTHSHFDHTGGNHEFAEIAAFDTALARARQTDGERAVWAGQLDAGQFRGAPPAALDTARHATQPYRITHWLADGDAIDLGGRSLQVIHTPGHSADSIALLDRAHRLLLTADTFYEGPIYLTNNDSDVAGFVDSCARLAALSGAVDWLLPSHNAPLAPVNYLAALATAAAQVHDAPPGSRLSFDGFAIWR
jgi:glyoxylase-like metal-dependent hydrolase (beta-lactamase superfamily II)